MRASSQRLSIRNIVLFSRALMNVGNFPLTTAPKPNISFVMLYVGLAAVAEWKLLSLGIAYNCSVIAIIELQ